MWLNIWDMWSVSHIFFRYVTEEETANEASAVIPGRETEGLN